MEIVKLIKKENKIIRVMCTMKVATECPGARKRPDKDEIVDIFHSSKALNAIIIKHVDLLWMETAFSVIPQL